MSHRTTSPATASMRLSAPKPTRATDPAATPAQTATTASATCHARPTCARSRARRTRRARTAGDGPAATPTTGRTGREGPALTPSDGTPRAARAPGAERRPAAQASVAWPAFAWTLPAARFALAFEANASPEDATVWPLLDLARQRNLPLRSA